MALYTPLSLDDADRLSRAHGLGAATSVTGIAAGSVNSNYIVEASRGRAFVRIYEDQEADGVAYEWALLEHLLAAGLPVPRRRSGPGPGEERVAGKPTALFDVVDGFECCQAMVDAERARLVGATLADVHARAASFPTRRAGRFEDSDMQALLIRIDAAARPELDGVTPRLREALARSGATLAGAPPEASGVIHGDLFRDNVRFDDAGVLALLDWESASDGLYVYDLAVTMLAWCCGDALDWGLCRAMLEGYVGKRALAPAENELLEPALVAAAARFTITRITDFHLRAAGAAQKKKDWRRFWMRFETVSEAADVRSMLGV